LPLNNYDTVQKEILAASAEPALQVEYPLEQADPVIRLIVC
jgi:hypothetical protein